ncbi:MAG: RNA polymerase sigma factor [Acidobacteria bacterium]|nr:RNA polymerase sigma factor [Acidobacteriota bacterium]
MPEDVRTVVESVFRRESGKIIAGLIRRFGDFDIAEEAMQDAMLAALDHWATEGAPGNPAAWITTTAQRKAIDRLRRSRTRDEYQSAANHDAPAPLDEMESPSPFQDDRLPLIFTCCHPALGLDAQVVLTLRTLGGLTTPEIARAFLVPEATLAQRLVRAKRKIREAKIPYRVPSAEQLPERLEAALSVLYLIFNEGYSATAGDALVRRDLASEAIRLTRLLLELMPGQHDVAGLLALMLLQDSRRAARLDADGELVVLEGQDRDKWDHGQIAEALRLLEGLGRIVDPGPYLLQAAIAAEHARAAKAQKTDWSRIAILYGALQRIQPSPVIALNRAVAVAMAYGYEQGLALMDELRQAGELDHYHLYHAARADLLRRLGRKDEAAAAYRVALRLATNQAERRYLERRLSDVSG